MSEELKACPFCGGEVSLYEYDMGETLEVQCTKCGTVKSHFEMDLGSVVKTWNTRTFTQEDVERAARGIYRVDNFPDPIGWEDRREAYREVYKNQATAALGAVGKIEL